MRFVILDHSSQGQTHWDLMLEQGQILLTWQVPCHPDRWGGRGEISCEKIFDHGLKYLSYEGPLSRNRGEVRQVAGGQYELLEKGERRWCVSLVGDTINGKLTLTHFKADQWQLVFAGE